MSDYTYPMILVEVPHQRKPKSWLANSDQDIVDAAYRMADRDDSEMSADFRNLKQPTVDDALQYLGHDLNGLLTFEQDDFKANRHRQRQHGWPHIETLVDREARDLGWTSVDPSEDERG